MLLAAGFTATPQHPPSKVFSCLFHAKLQLRSVGQLVRTSKRAMLVVTQRTSPSTVSSPVSHLMVKGV